MKDGNINEIFLALSDIDDELILSAINRMERKRPRLLAVRIMGFAAAAAAVVGIGFAAPRLFEMARREPDVVSGSNVSESSDISVDLTVPSGSDPLIYAEFVNIPQEFRGSEEETAELRDNLRIINVNGICYRGDVSRGFSPFSDNGKEALEAYDEELSFEKLGSLSLIGAGYPESVFAFNDFRIERQKGRGEHTNFEGFNIYRLDEKRLVLKAPFVQKDGEEVLAGSYPLYEKNEDGTPKFDYLKNLKYMEEESFQYFIFEQNAEDTALANAGVKLFSLLRSGEYDCLGLISAAEIENGESLRFIEAEFAPASDFLSDFVYKDFLKKNGIEERYVRLKVDDPDGERELDKAVKAAWEYAEFCSETFGVNKKDIDENIVYIDDSLDIVVEKRTGNFVGAAGQVPVTDDCFTRTLYRARESWIERFYRLAAEEQREKFISERPDRVYFIDENNIYLYPQGGAGGVGTGQSGLLLSRVERPDEDTFKLCFTSFGDKDEWETRFDIIDVFEVVVKRTGNGFAAADCSEAGARILAFYNSVKYGERQSVFDTSPSVFEDFEFVTEAENTITITKYLGNDEEVVIPENIYGKAVRAVENGAFENCSSIVSVTFPDMITKINALAFQSCGNLKVVNIGKNAAILGLKTTFTVGAFNDCPRLSEINVSEENPFYVSEDGVLFSKNKKSLIKYPEGKEGENYSVPEGVSDICGAFMYNKNLRSVSLPSSLKTIGEFAFFQSESLETVELSDGLQRIEEAAFVNCSELREMSLPDSVRRIESGDETTLPAFLRNAFDFVIIYKGEVYTAEEICEKLGA